MIEENIPWQSRDSPTEISRMAVAKHSEPYFTPWRAALRGWIETGCPMGGHKTVICPFCDTQQYFYDHAACVDCPYNMAGDNIFIDLAEFYKIYD